MDCHFLLPEIFPTQESNPCLSHCRQILYYLRHQGSPPTNHTFIQLSLITMPLNSCLEASTLNPFHIPDPIDHFLILNHQGGICDKCRKVGEELEIAETYSLIAWNDYFPYICIVYLKIFNEISYL